jgi:hypothetical protein
VGRHREYRHALERSHTVAQYAWVRGKLGERNLGAPQRDMFNSSALIERLDPL